MKKLLSILCVAVITLTAASCKKETVVTPGTQTIFTKATNWKTTDGGRTYTADVSVPEIDDHFDSNGTVSVSDDIGNGEYEQLPSVYDGITYRSTYTGGHVYIDAQNSDGTGTITVPPTLNLKIVLIY
ncbi:hypothetical protein NAF17_16205 [Mucilaginibacter sp. RB4R14]|uniref:hypothetical protein n=1 Tax=Mucilaginibacter aurantiaciroseus TaxID=2949308 RepID=UPI0020909941|nr:hypothetical protein [Mucilaginibacter aurantiaciroseus]MCO5937089.1 hypothetical protein [Mucilaginibacter aurantiaciroseus]